MKFQIGRFGLKTDPRGAHVVLRLKDRSLLGEVTGARYDAVTGAYRLTVRYFNGDPWPCEPSARAVEVLERTYSDVQP